VSPIIAGEVAAALDDRRPVVALESTIISHGLPRPRNLEVAREVEASVRDAGAVPATIAVLDGVPRLGLDDGQLEHLATSEEIRKLGVRDLAPAAAAAVDGATTVASTAVLAAGAGIDVFATGGLGGVHRGARESWDESADLTALGRTDLAVVCSGVKSILDVAATLERLESLGVAVVGYGTGRFPGFYLRDSGHVLDWSVSTPQGVAAVIAAKRALGVPAHALVVANPLPEDEALDPQLHDRVLAEGLALLEERGVSGKDVTPVLLEHFHRATGGASLVANERLIRRNAVLAAQIAVALRAR
jgi:pseudouridylate synthase